MAREEIASLEAFCGAISERLSHDGFVLRVKPGDHIVDDLGADSLVVLEYVLLLRELGLTIDLGSFDPDLLSADVAYGRWIDSRVGDTVF